MFVMNSWIVSSWCCSLSRSLNLMFFKCWNVHRFWFNFIIVCCCWTIVKWLAPSLSLSRFDLSIRVILKVFLHNIILFEPILLLQILLNFLSFTRINSVKYLFMIFDSMSLFHISSTENRILTLISQSINSLILLCSWYLKWVILLTFRFW